MRRSLSVRVSPLSINKIKEAAKSVRKLFGIAQPKIDMGWLLEVLISKGFVIICEANDPRLVGKYALTYPDQNKILISEATYDAAVDGDGRARFTIAHEIGHFFLHKGQMSFARSTNGNHKIFEDAEWQADTFASHFLIDDDYLSDNDTPEYISNLFGTSWQAAKVYVDKYR